MILSLLGEYGCVTADRIKAHFWKSSHKSRAHYRRLAVLRRRKLIENVLGDRSMTIGYRLTKIGKRMLADLTENQNAPVIRRAYKTQFEHDQLLIDLRQIFQASPLVKEFKTESELRREFLRDRLMPINWESRPTIPDATFVFEVPGRSMRVAVELELTAKLKKRYARIFKNHLLSKDWKLVIYIVKDASFQGRLMKTLFEVKDRDVQVRLAKTVNGIYFCDLENFLSNRLAVTLTNGKREISLEQIAQNLGIKA